VYNGKLLTVDDRSGLIYEILGDKLIPWVKLNDGPGNVAKGFKGEWMTVKGNLLYVGSLGKEWTNSAGEYVNDHPQYVKIIDPRGYIEHQPWVDRYIALRSACGINPPGYLIHESGCWSSVHNKWFFLPRRASHESYNDVDDEHRGTNLLITADNIFKHVEAKKITKLNVFRGFSSFKFIPGTNDQIIVALKSQETKGTISTYILSFDLNGKMLMDETNVGNYKFEGIEFL
jgi:soluble calcium-activated nucleotidase 1